MSKRAQELAAIGMETGREFASGEVALIHSIAAMLDAALPQRTRRAARADAPKLAFSPQKLHQEMSARVPDRVLCQPVNQQDFAIMARNLRAVDGLEAADLHRLCGWIAAGWTDKWPMQLTFGTVARNIGKYLQLARAWDTRGQQVAGSGGRGVGVALDEADAADIGDDFG